MKWRRSGDESDATQRQHTRLAFHSLDKDPRDARLTLEEFSDDSDIRFVANLDSEVVHLFVRADTSLYRIGDLRTRNQGKRWRVAIGNDFSGGFAMSLFLSEEFGLANPNEDISQWPFEVFQLDETLRSSEHVLREDFQRQNRLEELFSRDREERLRFAQDKPEFVVHRGAQSVYHPEEFDLGQFQSYEALYSLIASFAIGAFSSGRWILRWRERRQAHRLDRWIQDLLDIELRQLKLDSGPDDQHESQLQDLLDEVTTLRMQALSRFSAHELKEDPSGQYFIEMCHSLSNKINAKVSRQRTDTRFDELIAALKDGQDASG